MEAWYASCNRWRRTPRGWNCWWKYKVRLLWCTDCPDLMKRLAFPCLVTNCELAFWNRSDKIAGSCPRSRSFKKRNVMLRWKSETRVFWSQKRRTQDRESTLMNLFHKENSSLKKCIEKMTKSLLNPPKKQKNIRGGRGTPATTRPHHNGGRYLTTHNNNGNPHRGHQSYGNGRNNPNPFRQRGGNPNQQRNSGGRGRQGRHGGRHGGPPRGGRGGYRR